MKTVTKLNLLLFFHGSGCVPLLVQLIYNQDSGVDGNNQDRDAHFWILSEADKETRASAAQALHNLVYNNNDDRKVKREIRILKLLELIRDYCDKLRDGLSLLSHLRVDHSQPLLNQGNLFPIFFDPYQ